MRVLLTGASGFVGSHLLRHLLGRGDGVEGTCLEGPKELFGVRLHHADLLDRSALARVVEEAAPAAIVHLAALTHVGESWERLPEYFQVNVLGTENLLAVAGERPVVFLSSAEVYGLVPESEQPIPEERPAAPCTPYALTKAAAERLALLKGAVVARCFNLVGTGQSARFALPGFAHQLAEIARGAQPPVLKVGNLSARRDFLHIDDAASALAILLDRGERGAIYNVASERAVAIGEALTRLVAVSGVAVRVEEDPARMRPVDLPVLAGDCSRLRALGWRPRLSLDTALSDLWEAARAAA